MYSLWQERIRTGGQSCSSRPFLCALACGWKPSVVNGFFLGDVIAITSWAPDVNLVRPLLGRNANHKGAVFMFCFILKSYKTKRVRLECFSACLVLQKALLATVISTINKIPNIPQCTLPPRPIYQTLLFDFSRVWFQD